MQSLADLYQQQLSKEGLEKASQEKMAADLLREIGVEDINALSDEEAQAAGEKLAAHVAMQKEAQANFERGDFMAQGFLARMTEEGVNFPKFAENMAKVAGALSKQQQGEGTDETNGS